MIAPNPKGSKKTIKSKSSILLKKGEKHLEIFKCYSNFPNSKRTTNVFIVDVAKLHDQKILIMVMILVRMVYMLDKLL